MRRNLKTVVAIATAVAAGLVVMGSPGSQGAVAARAGGDVGAFDFHDTPTSPGATCVYTNGRLSAISLATPTAAARPEWEPTGQYILWGARLQTRVGKGSWQSVGGTRYSEAVVGHAGPLNPLPALSIPRVYGDPRTSYRVVQTINWYFNNRNAPVVQGQASNVVANYSAQSKVRGECEGVTATKLPPLGLITSDELDKVDVSFAGRKHGAKVKYTLKRGSLPPGLSLKKKNGRVTGTIPAEAINTTVTYQSIQQQTFAFTVAAKANGRTSKKSYNWSVFDTAFVMPSYYGRYGCGPDCQGNTEPVPNISSLGPKISFGCSTQPQPGLPANNYSVIYQQDFQQEDGSLAPSTGLTFRYGDVFKWWYYDASC